MRLFFRLTVFNLTTNYGIYVCDPDPHSILSLVFRNFTPWEGKCEGLFAKCQNIKILKDNCSKTYEDDVGMNITYLTTLKQEIHRAVNEPRSYTHRTNVC